MSKILIYSDPHRGLRRQANTSLQSSLRLQKTLGKSSDHISINLKKALGCNKAFCLGDLFDTYSNSEQVIESAYRTVGNTDVILAGNHDLENRAGSVGSLQLLSKLSPGNKFLINELGGSESFHVEQGNTDFLFVPHTANQELFEKALQDAYEFAAKSSKYRILCLHCNYNLTYENTPDTSLNLSTELAAKLLAEFHFLFMGHEHIPVEHHSGRLVVIGNTFPTGFSDLSDKRVLVYDTEAGTYESHKVWENDTYSGPVSEAPETPTSFMDLIDDLPLGEANKLVTKWFKDENSLAIRLRSKDQKRITGEEVTKACLESLPDLISAHLKTEHPELHALWEELSA